MHDGGKLRSLFERLADPDHRADALRSAPASWVETCRGIAAGPDPTGAALAVLRLPPQILRRGPLPPSAVTLLHQGGYPGRMLAACPEAIEELAAELPAPQIDPTTAIAELREDIERAGADDAIGRFRTRAFLRTARREVEGGPLEDVAAELSCTAAVCVEAALHHFGIADRLVVFGMGKLGGAELNYHSDIDLIFVHHDDDASDEPTRRAATVRLHDKLRRVIRLLEGAGRFKPLYRVDMRLRPFGARGPLSTSLSATESYYERHGRPWERQAWLRARPIAGDHELGETLLKRLGPFVYRRSVTPAIFSEIGELMERARRDASTSSLSADDDIDLKLDRGGIREVEFFVQGLQLLHGGRNKRIRSPGTLPALDRLLAAGLVSDREHRQLIDAYRFLRKLEHRVQLAEGEQTHRLPAAPEARTLIAARFLGPGPNVREEFEAQLRAHREAVATTTATLAPEYTPTLTDRARGRALSAILDSGAPRSVRREALQHFGLSDPDEAEATISHLQSRSDGAWSASGIAAEGANRLLLACLEAADPDLALARLVEFAAPRPAHFGVWRIFAEPTETGHDLTRLAAELLGTSDPLCRGLLGWPGDRGLDEATELLQSAGAPRQPSAAELAAQLQQQRPDPRGLDASLLRFKHRAIVSIAMRDLAQRPDPLAVGRSLSRLADLVVRQVARDLAATTAAERPGAHAMTIGVFALGKFGMEAMDYGSDLDIMLVFDREADARAAQSEAIRLGQTLVSRLQNRSFGSRLYEVDMRLRPSGRQGLLVTAMPAFKRYHAEPLPVWERLALLRMRPVAEFTIEPGLCGPTPDPHPGPAMASAIPGPLCATAMDVVARGLVGGGALSAGAIAAAVRELKSRVESEVARETRNPPIYHAKAGVGGVLEAELLVGALQLKADPSQPAARVRGIVEGAQALGDAGILPREEADALSAAYRFQRLLLNRLRMTGGGGPGDADRFAQNSPRLTTLARRMGLPSAEALLDRFYRSRKIVRGAFDRHL